VVAAGNTSLSQAIQLQFQNSVKSGDVVTFTVGKAAKTIRQLADSYPRARFRLAHVSTGPAISAFVRFPLATAKLVGTTGAILNL
jgi:hypothetical protein